jgi:hypothetical protein
MNEIDEGQPFTDTSAPADPNEGHCMIYAASDLQSWTEATYDATGELVTWGQKQAVSPAWNDKYAYQAIVPVTKDYIRLNGTSVEGLNLAQMIADSRDAS